MNGPMELSSKNNSIHTVYVCLLVNNTEHYYGSLQTRLAKFIYFFASFERQLYSVAFSILCHIVLIFFPFNAETSSFFLQMNVIFANRAIRLFIQ